MSAPTEQITTAALRAQAPENGRDGRLPPPYMASHTLPPPYTSPRHLQSPHSAPQPLPPPYIAPQPPTPLMSPPIGRAALGSLNIAIPQPASFSGCSHGTNFAVPLNAFPAQALRNLTNPVAASMHPHNCGGISIPKVVCVPVSMSTIKLMSVPRSQSQQSPPLQQYRQQCQLCRRFPLQHNLQHPPLHRLHHIVQHLLQHHLHNPDPNNPLQQMERLMLLLRSFHWELQEELGLRQPPVNATTGDPPVTPPATPLLTRRRKRKSAEATSLGISPEEQKKVRIEKPETGQKKDHIETPELIPKPLYPDIMDVPETSTSE